MMTNLIDERVRWQVGNGNVGGAWLHGRVRAVFQIPDSGHVRVLVEPDDKSLALQVRGPADLHVVEVKVIEDVHIEACATMLLRACKVLTLDPRIREWLAEHDPQALRQADRAVEVANENGVPTELPAPELVAERSGQ